MLTADCDGRMGRGSGRQLRLNRILLWRQKDPCQGAGKREAAARLGWGITQTWGHTQLYCVRYKLDDHRRVQPPWRTPGRTCTSSRNAAARQRPLPPSHAGTNRDKVFQHGSQPCCSGRTWNEPGRGAPHFLGLLYPLATSHVPDSPGALAFQDQGQGLPVLL